MREFYGTNVDFNAQKTDNTGQGGFVNVPVQSGVVNVTATPLALTTPSSKRLVVVRPGTTTLLNLLPNQ